MTPPNQQQVLNKIYKFKNRKLVIENGLKILLTLTSKIPLQLTELMAALDIIICGLPDKVNLKKVQSKRRFIEAYKEAFKNTKEKTWFKIGNAVMQLIFELPIDRKLAVRINSGIDLLVNSAKLEKQNRYWLARLESAEEAVFANDLTLER